MGTLARTDRGLWPKMVKDFFGAENPFDWTDRFWLPENSVEVPSANVIENDKEFKLELSAPGFGKEDFKVDVEDGVLCISAEKEKSSEEEKENYRKKEFSYSSIRRSFTLPENVKEDKIDAKYENGILKIVLPKMAIESKKPAKEIKVG